jgi:uncharacterized small protein (DUF1192 family)|tara:strand:- start:42 stop:188 length:147 start_codon:yes stop_codon:yes gene_type:complete
MKQTLEERIKYLENELAAHGRQDGWVITAFKQELARLKEKQARKVKTK